MFGAWTSYVDSTNIANTCISNSLPLISTNNIAVITASTNTWSGTNIFTKGILVTNFETIWGQQVSQNDYGILSVRQTNGTGVTIGVDASKAWFYASQPVVGARAISVNDAYFLSSAQTGAGGWVGLGGNTIPSYPLDVTGNANISGAVNSASIKNSGGVITNGVMVLSDHTNGLSIANSNFIYVAVATNQGKIFVSSNGVWIMK